MNVRGALRWCAFSISASRERCECVLVLVALVRVDSPVALWGRLGDIVVFASVPMTCLVVSGSVFKWVSTSCFMFECLLLSWLSCTSSACMEVCVFLLSSVIEIHVSPCVW